MRSLWVVQRWSLSQGIPRCLSLKIQLAGEVQVYSAIKTFRKVLDQSSPIYSKHLEINMETNSARTDFMEEKNVSKQRTSVMCQ